MPRTPKKKKQTDARIGLRFSGEQLERLREVGDLVGMSDDASTARYVIARGMEALSAQVRSKRLLDKMEAQYSPQELFEFMGRPGYMEEPGKGAPRPLESE